MSKPKVIIVIYSMYGHILSMAREMKKGLEEAGCEASIRRVPETLPEEVLAKMHAAPPAEDIPVMLTADMLEADGLAFGLCTRFGRMTAQMSAFVDTWGGHWQAGALVGKPVCCFTSTATQSGGNQTTILSFLSNLAHNGMMFVPMGYTNPALFNMDEIHGASPWGAGTLAGPTGARQPTDLEKGLAKHQGTIFAGTVKTLAAGKAKLASETPAVVQKIDDAKKLDEEKSVASTGQVDVSKTTTETKPPKELAESEEKKPEEAKVKPSCACVIV